MEIRLAHKAEVPELTKLSKAAFDTDVQVGGTEPGGPPEYDNERWHEAMRAEGRLYSALENGALIGGALLFGDSREPRVLYVGRIFVDPKQHGKGYGLALMRGLEEMLTDVDIWRLDTPVWNVRTNRFYTKLGYAEVKRDEECVYYQKLMRRDGQ